jgi:hypothetical protein
MEKLRAKLQNLNPKQKQQFLLYSLISLVALALVVMLLWQGAEEQSQLKEMAREDPKTLMFHPILSNEPKEIDKFKTELDEDALYRHEVKQQYSVLEGDNQELKSIVSDLQGEMEKLIQNNTAAQRQRSAPSLELAERLSALELQLGELQRLGQGEMKREPEGEVNKIELKLEALDTDIAKTSDNYIRAGSVVRGILLSGVRAATGTTAASDPVPMLIGLRESETIGSGQLKECYVIASGYGDLSSESIKVRPETLSCVNKNNKEIVTTSVVGFIADGDGTAGLKGKVEENTGGFVGLSALGSTISGLSAAVMPERGRTINENGIVEQALGKAKRLERGFLGGGSKSMDQLSQYYLERAKQLQPYIFVAAKRAVDVVFTDDIKIGVHEKRKDLKRRKAVPQEEESWQNLNLQTNHE